MGKILMIADDFTGASDAGVQMTKNGIDAHIVFDPSDVEPGKSYVIDSESRNISAEEAYQKVKDILQNVKKYSFEHYYKKIDSTLRGNIGSELKAELEEIHPDMIVFNPANPDSDRTVVDGILYFGGKRVMETEIMRDPLCFVKDDNLKSMIEKEMKETVQHISLTDVRNKSFHLNGSRFLTFDVLDKRDLENVVEFVLKQKDKKILWVGSAGMANALFKAFRPKYPVLSLIGSISDTSRAQVNKALAEGASLVKMDIGDLLKGGNLETVAEKAISELKAGQDVIVTSARELADYHAAVTEGKSRGMKRTDVAKYTQEMIGKLSSMILKEAKVSGCFLTGGDTAISVSRHNHAHGATIQKEVLATVALVLLDGGDHPGLPCVVKGGSIGDENTLTEAIKFIKDYIREV
ncbi:hypothetical protein B5F53_06905 [Blautia sp. An249]|uniref:four-carbon acid sugar kinase family protein n=1 Tax=Blautia sp. An249 TaxID=1965603 RepID=UPI000B396A03|nr:four-carbon acid sugar kinase family protein [Blautia sp. An249]OUO79675.1 hypothetical protein B5F53_06905 [Blautia sp. An249]